MIRHYHINLLMPRLISLLFLMRSDAKRCEAMRSDAKRCEARKTLKILMLICHAPQVLDFLLRSMRSMKFLILNLSISLIR